MSNKRLKTDRPKAHRPQWREPIGVLGFGVEGESTLRWLHHWGYRNAVVLDRVKPKTLPPETPGRFGEDYLLGLREVHTVIRSPGLRPGQPEIEAFRARGGVMTSQVETAFELWGRENVIGITGTLGKGTTCSLLSAMLEKGAVPHRLAGNIGVPPLDALADLASGSRLLLELSSFQLSTLSESPGIAVVLQTTSEHLDWHASRQEYWEHKAYLTRFQQPGDLGVFFADAEGSRWIGSQGLGRKISLGRSGTVRIAPDSVVWPDRGLTLRLDETALIGSFNLENLAAAATVALELGVSMESIRAAARDFSPLEHRLEWVRRLGDLAFYNDSYATRPEATLGAVRALRGKPLGLILGGSEKFADFAELAQGLAQENHVQAVALLGQTASRLEAELAKAGAWVGKSRQICATLDEALVYLCQKIPSGSVLLSPACASFGLFDNYKERGKEFKRLVSALPLQV